MKYISCGDCPWCDKKEFKCSIDNNYYGVSTGNCCYINKNFSITNYGLKIFYMNNDIKSDCLILCEKCPYHFDHRCKFDGSQRSHASFECLYVDKDYNITKEGKKKLLEDKL